MANKTLSLSPAHFKSKPSLLVKTAKMQAIAFRYSTGVCGIRLKDTTGFLEILPFQGQQIWKAVVGGRNLTMESPVKEPVPGVDFLKTYGAYLVHCGARRIAAGTPEDPHPLHGELPNASYQKARVMAGKDKKGNFLSVSGEYEYIEFFGDHYLACPTLKWYENETLFEVSMTITNKNKTPMELMYLAHINYKPVDHARIVYSAPCTPEYVRLRETIPSHIKVSESYLSFLKELKNDPAIHHVLKPGMAYDPEAVFYIHYLPDNKGYAHTMQIHPDGTSDYVRHRPEELPCALRWISRTPNHDAIAIIEPATAEADGYVAEKNKENIRILQGGESFSCTITMGMLDKKTTARMEQMIKENFMR